MMPGPVFRTEHLQWGYRIDRMAGNTVVLNPEEPLQEQTAGISVNSIGQTETSIEEASPSKDRLNTCTFPVDVSRLYHRI
jgi:hypothetical protein